MIGQFDGSYYTLQPAKFTSLFKLKSPPIWTRRYETYPTDLVFSVPTVSYGTSFSQ